MTVGRGHRRHLNNKSNNQNNQKEQPSVTYVLNYRARPRPVHNDDDERTSDTMTDDLAPRCVRCRKRHLPSLPCWRGRYSIAKTRRVYATQGRVCWLCGIDGADTVDHVIPRSRCGTDAPENLRPAHDACNKARGNLLAPEYGARLTASALIVGSRSWLSGSLAPRPATTTRTRPPKSLTAPHGRPSVDI